MPVVNRHMKKYIALALAIATTLTGCQSVAGNTALGAAAGAAIGALRHGRGEDALKGAAIGAGAGFLGGHALEAERRAADARRGQERYYQDGPRGTGLPYARPTDRPGFVRSPYPPYHIIDVRSIPPGAEVMDPSCERNFLNP
jgi:hypothetical protein